jgi:UDP-2,3-diacylglucosamine hydrolase
LNAGTMARTLFVSDLHLSPERPAINELFLRFLRDRAAGADALYVLGDLFEYWVGDDAAAHPAYRPVIAGLRALTDSGVPLYVMHGNRDFLLGHEFERMSGARLLPDPTCITLYGTRVLLTHGDLLCTDDTEYQRLRALVRNETWQKELLKKSVAEREAMARSLRDTSRQAMAGKKAEIMDVTPAAVDAVLREHGVRDMIHGHTHRPADHRFLLDGQPARRIVLGDWYEQGSVLTCDAAGWCLESLPVDVAA